MALIAIMLCILCSFQILARPKRYLILLDLENKVISHFIIERKNRWGYYSFAFAAQSASPSYQLDLALTWNRADIARTEIFTKDQKWEVWV